LALVQAHEKQQNRVIRLLTARQIEGVRAFSKSQKKNQKRKHTHGFQKMSNFDDNLTPIQSSQDTKWSNLSNKKHKAILNFLLSCLKNGGKLQTGALNEIT